MKLEEIELEILVDALDEVGSDYANFFRPMLGYEAVLKLYAGIDDSAETYITEIEDETGFEVPSDLINFYICTNGGSFGEFQLFPLIGEKNTENTIHKLNVINKSLKESIGLKNSTLLLGKYNPTETYIICDIENGVYTYKLWDATKKEVTMTFEYIVQLVALEISYITEYDELMEFANSKD